MVSLSEYRSYDQYIGAAIVVLTVIGTISGVLLGNWSIFNILLDETTLILVFLVLMYRLVIAVEHQVFDD